MTKLSHTRVVRSKRLSARAHSKRRPELWLALLFPRLAARANRSVLRLPPTSHIRRALLWRAVRSGYEVLNATKQVNIHVFSPDVVLIEPDDVLGHDDPLEQRVHTGREAYLRSVRKLTETWDDFRMEPEELFDLGDRLVILVRWRGRGHASGIPLDQALAYVYTVRDGQIARHEVYADRAEALEAVGLSK